MGGTGAVRVMLVEDHAAFRQALAFLLSGEPDLEVVADAVLEKVEAPQAIAHEIRRLAAGG
jgi:DNA-binding NarL/FixJ family response regulator